MQEENQDGLVMDRNLPLFEPERLMFTGSTIQIGGDSFPFLRAVSADIDSEKREIDVSRERLLEQIEEYFDIVAETLHSSPALQEEMLGHLQNAKELIRDLHDDPERELSRAQFEVRRVHVEISKEQQIQRGEKRLSWVVPALVVLYTAAIVGVIALNWTDWTTDTEVPVIGVPVSVLIWAANGSLAAILYRFYTRRRGRVSREIRWLIARPVVGIMMGAFTYLAVLSGLLIFGTATGSEANISAIPRPQLLWMLAFLGGFSDRIFKAIIDLVAGKIASRETDVIAGQTVG